MHRSRGGFHSYWHVLFLVIGFFAASAVAGSLRIVTYNIEADTGGYTTPRPGMSTVLQGIGNESVNGTTRPIDVLGLQETTSNTTTVTPLVTSLNSLYGAGTYAMSTYQATQYGSATSGNGPNAMVYNTTTLQLIASVGIGTPTSSGFPRQPVRYQFRPVGGTAANDFYVYVSHCKAGTTTTDKNRRNVEAQALRANAATLASDARVIYMGDFNLTSSSEAFYTAMTNSGTGQAFDPPNRPGNWDSNSSFVDVMTYGSTGLYYRDDFEMVTSNVMNDSSGLHYVAGSYHAFANNGSVALGGSITGTTALQGLTNRSAVLSALTTASDHLPVVADYQINLAVPTVTYSPAAQSVCPGGTASFTVTASGTGTLSYQWQKNDVNVTTGGHYAGTATSTLTVSSAAGDDAANYRCVVSNSNGSTNSSEAGLTLKAATTVTQQPSAQRKGTGGTATFAVAGSGEGTLAYQWQKNQANLTDGGHYAGCTSTTLTVSSCDSSDAADYRCVVTGGCGAATSDAVSLVVNPPGPPPDLDRDGDVDPSDLVILEACFTGPAVPYDPDSLPAGCALTPDASDRIAADFNTDGYVDLEDFGVLQRCYSGQDVPADTNCANEP